MVHALRFLSSAVGLLLCAASATAAPDNTALSSAFYVGSHGWHTSIIVPRAQIPRDACPRGITDRTFSDSTFLEIGWGDRKFYTAPKPGVAMAIDAALSPGPSVLHIVGLQPPLARALPWSALVKVPCTHAEFTNLCRTLGQSFDRDAVGRAIPIQRGLYGETSWFYPARGRYSLLNTCDTWTARMMRAGGLPADTSLFGTRSAGAIIAQARRLTAQKSQVRIARESQTTRFRWSSSGRADRRAAHTCRPPKK